MLVSRNVSAAVLLAISVACGSSGSSDGAMAPPKVLSTIPADGAVGIPVTVAVQVVFDSPLDPATVNGSSVKLQAGASQVAGSVAYDPAARIATFTPSSPLAFLTLHAARVTTAVKGTNGLALEADRVFTFTTIADTIPPTVTGVTPTDLASAVPVGGVLTATFSEPIDPATLTASTFTLTAAGAPVSGAVAYDPVTRTATFTPGGPLPYLAACTATVAAGVADLAGNPLGVAVSWSFTVEADTVPPTIVDLSPAENATEVAIGAELKVTFSEPVDPATLTAATFYLRYQASTIPASVSYDAATRVATLTPTATLANLLVYSATVTTGVADLAGNPLGASRTWSFTTEPDRTPPTVVSTIPAAGATNVPTSTTIQVCFSENVDQGTLGGAVQVNGFPVFGYYDFVSRCFTTPTQYFGFGQTITVTVTTAVKDLAGNALAAPYTWTFQIVPDTTPPTVTGSSPVSGARLVARTLPSITVSFDEPMDAATLDATTFTVSGLTGTVAMQGSQTAVFTPSAPLAAATTYTVAVSTGAKDVAGNGLAAPYTFSFRTLAASGTRVNADTPAIARTPQVAFDGAGNGMVVWTFYTGTGEKLAFASKPAGGAWGAEQVLDVAPEGRFADVVLTPCGTGFGLAYARTDPNGYSNVIVRFSSATTWDAGTTLATGVYGVSGLKLLAGSTTWLAAWDASTYTISARVYSGGTWSAAQALNKSGNWAAGSSGDTYLVITSDYTRAVLAYTWNSTWSTASAISSATGGSLVGPVVTSGPAGVAVAWARTDTAIPATTTVSGRVYAAGAWGAEQVLRVAAGAPASSFLAASDATSHLVAFAQGGAIQAVRYSGGAWTAETVPGGGTAPALLAASLGSYALAWAVGSYPASYSASVRTTSWSAAVSLGSSLYGTALAGSADKFAFAATTSTNPFVRVYVGSAWSAPSTFETSSLNYMFALAPAGSGFGLAWGTGGALKVSTYTTAWSAATNLVTQVHPASALDPRVAVRGSHAVVTWRQYDGSNTSGWPRLYAATWNGTSWSLPILLDAVGGDPAEVLASSADDFTVYWFSASAYGRNLRRYSFATGTWSAPITIATSWNSFMFQLAHTGSEFIALYDDSTGATWQTISADGTTWPAATNLGLIGWNLRLTSGGGTTMLVRQASASANATVSASRYLGGGTWSAPFSLGNAASSNDLVAAASGAGGVAALFDAYGGSATVAGRIYDAGAWGASTSLGAGYHPRVSAGASSFLAAWRYSSSGPIYARVGSGGSWASPVSFASSSVSGYSPASTSASQAVLVTENPSPGTPGPVVYSISGAQSSSSPIDTTAGYYVDACLAGDPGGSALVATWTRADPTSAARVLMALPDP